MMLVGVYGSSVSCFIIVFYLFIYFQIFHKFCTRSSRVLAHFIIQTHQQLPTPNHHLVIVCHHVVSPACPACCSYFGLIGRETAEGLRPKPEDDRSEKAEWIRQKYVDRAFMAPTEKEVVEAGLLQAAADGDLIGCVTNLTSSASVNCTPNGVGTDTPLLAAVQGGHIAVAEYLLLNGADVNVRAGPKSWGALHRAAHMGNVDMVSTLLYYKANLDEADIDGNTPLALAIASASGDVVTLLRLASLGQSGNDELIGIALSDFRAKRQEAAEGT